MGVGLLKRIFGLIGIVVMSRRMMRMPRKLCKHLCVLCHRPTTVGGYLYREGHYYHRKCFYRAARLPRL